MQKWTSIAASLLVSCHLGATAADLNIPEPVAQLEQMLSEEPFEIQEAEISRPKAKGDITLKAEMAFGTHAPITVKLRKSEPGAESFNNIPRYDLAAYELQKLLMDAPEYVVPPTALRMVPLAEFHKYSPDVEPTFKGSDEVLSVIQYWLHEVKVIEDVLKPDLFAADPVYARHIGQLNVFTYLIEHGDSNAGNFLLSRADAGPRVFSIDNGVAFAHNESDRGELWKTMRVDKLPADTVERLRALTLEELETRLGVLAQWELHGGRFEKVLPGSNLSRHRGVRRKDDTVQMGLTHNEIRRVWRQSRTLLKMIDRGKIEAT